MRQLVAMAFSIALFVVGFASGVVWQRDYNRPSATAAGRVAIPPAATPRAESGRSFTASNGYTLRGKELEEADEFSHQTDKLAAEVEYSWSKPPLKPKR